MILLRLPTKEDNSIKLKQETPSDHLILGAFFVYDAAMPISIIIVIGWLYVTLLVAANEPSITAGVFSFAFYGALPCGLILYFAGSKMRRERKKHREMQARETEQKTEQKAEPETPG